MKDEHLCVSAITRAGTQSGKLSQSHEPDVFLVTRWWVQESLNYYCGKLGTNRSYPRQVDWSNSISIKGVCKSATTVAWALDYRNLGAQGESRQCILLRIWAKLSRLFRLYLLLPWGQEAQNVTLVLIRQHR